MVAVLAAFGAVFLIWFHNDPKPQSSAESACRGPEVMTTAADGPYHDQVRIEKYIRSD